MKIELKNIGSIEHSIIDLDKNLIVFTGGNNSGKTYVSYCLYGLAKFNPTYAEDFLDEVIDSNFEDLFKNGVEEINLNILTKSIESIEWGLSKQFKNFLPILFGMDSDNFLKSEINLKLGTVNEFAKHLLNINFKISLGTVGATVDIKKEKGSEILLLNLSRNISENDKLVNDLFLRIKSSIKRFILRYTTSAFANFYVTFLPAERIGISVFSKELFLNRFSSTNEILALDELNRNKVVSLLNKNFNRYSLVIQDSLRNQEDLTRALNVGGRFQQLASELESKILKGNLAFDENGDVIYNSNGQSLKIQATGSIVKSLASFVFFLRYQANEGSVLIMDEPEINLHPINQRIIAKVLAKISNMGIKVIISTHSDYIIREFNNLIMLDKKGKETQLLLKKYDYSETEVLNKNNVDAYYFSGNKTEQIEVTETGFEVEAIDDTIALQNKATSEIKWTLFED